MDDERKFTTVSIPTELFKKAEERIKGTGFATVSSYVTHVLREVIADTEKPQGGEAFSKEDEERVRQRLRALGYL